MACKLDCSWVGHFKTQCKQPDTHASWKCCGHLGPRSRRLMPPHAAPAAAAAQRSNIHCVASGASLGAMWPASVSTTCVSPPPCFQNATTELPARLRLLLLLLRGSAAAAASVDCPLLPGCCSRRRCCMARPLVVAVAAAALPPVPLVLLPARCGRLRRGPLPPLSEPPQPPLPARLPSPLPPRRMSLARMMRRLAAANWAAPSHSRAAIQASLEAGPSWTSCAPAAWASAKGGALQCRVPRPSPATVLWNKRASAKGDGKLVR